ncbi:lysophospholipid acyltransferase family protein [Propionibacterium sp.]|uniref:lysophospholipid acyltransferase family protein n=1 Tax=Propionibacterium sp. TaxID=1977903 RepID=UPI0039EAA9D0
MQYGLNSWRYKSRLVALARNGVKLGMLKPAVDSAIKVHKHGLEHLDGVESPVIVNSNHCGHFDAPLVMLTMPRRLTNKLATGAAADYFFDTWYKAIFTELIVNAYPVNRTGSRNYRGLSGELLEEGISLLIFAEGTRSRTGGMGRFNPGSAALAISHNVPILPVAMVGAWAAWPPKQARWTPGRPDVHVVYGSPMRANTGEIAHEFSERVRRKIIELHDSTARAYHMPTQAEMMHLAAIESAKRQLPGHRHKEH